MNNNVGLNIVQFSSGCTMKYLTNSRQIFPGTALPIEQYLLTVIHSPKILLFDWPTAGQHSPVQTSFAGQYLNY